MKRLLVLLVLAGCHHASAPLPSASSAPVEEAASAAPSATPSVVPDWLQDRDSLHPPAEHLLGGFTTKFKTQMLDGRVENIRLAAAAIDGVVIQPGEEFSFNRRVGPRTAERGFKNAPTIVMGEVFEGIGGGTCQVSSTLYVAVLRTGLEVTDRRPHSRPSSYVGPGLDATVSFPAECEKKSDPTICYDLKFKNTYDFPIRVAANLEDLCLVEHFNPKTERCLAIALWGTGAIPYIEYSWRAWETPPFEKSYHRVPYWKDDRKQLKQSGAPGLKGALTITTWHAGVVLSKREVYSEYKPVPEVWNVGMEWKDTE